MEKLLHELLREPDTELCIGEMLELIVTGKTEDCTGRLCGQCIVDAMNALADEIERTYHPIPCDPDGNPWRIGDDCITAEGEEATIAGYRNGCRVFIDLHDERCFARCYASDLKRPTPKVYDADGVEITSGTTGWLTDGTRVYVDDIHTDEPTPKGENAPWINVAYGNTLGWCLASDFTYERPVFDAEGVRICKGDTVWTKDGEKHAVVTVHQAGEKPAPYHDLSEKPFVRYGDYGSGWNYADEITHREPDSLEKLLVDMMSDDRMRGTSYIPRVQSLIERGA